MNADISHEIDGEYSMKFEGADATIKSPVQLENVGDQQLPVDTQGDVEKKQEE